MAHACGAELRRGYGTKPSFFGTAPFLELPTGEVVSGLDAIVRLLALVSELVTLDCTDSFPRAYSVIVVVIGRAGGVSYSSADGPHRHASPSPISDVESVWSAGVIECGGEARRLLARGGRVVGMGPHLPHPCRQGP